jgi:hypothetical protein
VTVGGAIRTAEMTDTTPGDFSICTANLCTTISLFPLFGDLGFKVEETKCADLRHRELRNIYALLLTLHGSRRAALLNGRISYRFFVNLLISVRTRNSSK